MVGLKIVNFDYTHNNGFVGRIHFTLLECLLLDLIQVLTLLFGTGVGPVMITTK